ARGGPAVRLVCITGVTGFIGSHLARALVREGWKVHGVKRSASELSRLREAAGRVVFHDVDREPVDALLPQPCPDAVVHLATNYGRDGAPPSQVARDNTLFPLTLLEAALRRGVPLFVHADTCFTPQYRHLQAYTLSKRQFAAWGKALADGATRFVNLELY